MATLVRTYAYTAVLKWIGISTLISVLPSLYSYKLYTRMAYDQAKEESELSFAEGRDIRVPCGPLQTVEIERPRFRYSAIDLGHSTLLSSDAMGDLVMYVDKACPPQDAGIAWQTGLYFRGSNGAYRFLGQDLAQLSADGDLLQVTKRGTVLVNGRAATTVDMEDGQRNTPSLFAAANGRLLSQRFGRGGFHVTEKDGSNSRIDDQVVVGESLGLRALRSLGACEDGSERVRRDSIQTTVRGDVYAFSDGNRGLFRDAQFDGGRLCELNGKSFEPVPETKDLRFNRVTCASPNGTLALNLIDNCSWAARPCVFHNGVLTRLPIPQGLSYATVLGVSDDGTAILRGGKSAETFLYRDKRLFSFDAICRQSVGHSLDLLSPYDPRRQQLPAELRSLRIPNQILGDGSILCQTKETEPRVVLLQNP